MRLNLQKCFNITFTILCVVLVVIYVPILKTVPNINITRNVVKEKNQDQDRELVIPTVLMACNISSLARTMMSLTTFRSNSKTFPILVAPYCQASTLHQESFQNIISLYAWDSSITFLQKPITAPDRTYNYALNHVFRTLKYKAVVVLEEDLDIAPDFFEYFYGTYSLLTRDPSIWCISAWNDNCIKGLVEETQDSLLHRTHFFPGMGWMLLSETWEEIQIKSSLQSLTIGVYDDLHTSVVTAHRVCIRPEISRTYYFGEYGPRNVHLPFGHIDRKLRLLHLQLTQFTHIDLSYLLQAKESYFIRFVYNCTETTVEKVKTGQYKSKYVRITYRDSDVFSEVAHSFGLMDDLRNDVPPTGLYGIVTFFFNGTRVFLAPLLVHNT